VLREVAERVVSGWPAPVEASFQERPDGAVLVLSWRGDDVVRGVVVLAREGGGSEVRGVVQWPGVEPDVRSISRSPEPVAPDPLTLAVRLAMETVANWRPVPSSPGQAMAEPG
jgi:hypothetical protein